MLAKPEYFSPPNEVCCWPGRCSGAFAGRGAIGKKLLTGSPYEPPSGIITRCIYFFRLTDASFPLFSSTKNPILCSKWPKTGVPDPKSAQKCRFCVKTAQNLGKIAHSDTKTSILCSKSQKMWVLEGKSAQKSRFCARNAGATPHRARVP